MEVSLLDKVPGFNLYIGGFISLRRPKALANCKITHILSVIDWKFAHDSPLLKGYQHCHIPVNDIDDENLIEWFPKSNAFIEQGLTYRQHVLEDPGANLGEDRDINGSSGVLVHCAMGKSRSATIIIAYLLWDSHHRNPSASSAPTLQPNYPPRTSCDTTPEKSEPLTPESALALLRQSRPFAEPNDGFMEQLHLYHSMDCPDTIDSQPKYQRWLYQKNVQESLAINRAPEVDYIRFEDEHEEEKDDSGSTAGKRDLDIKCRKCRRLLAKSTFLVDHQPASSTTMQNQQHQKQKQKQQVTIADTEKECAHLFLHPLSWMKRNLEEGGLDGRLICPNQKCEANVGKFAWQGMKCSCGGWVTPGFGLARARVDEVAVLRKTVNAANAHAGAPTAVGVRLPPGMKREGGHL